MNEKDKKSGFLIPKKEMPELLRESHAFAKNFLGIFGSVAVITVAKQLAEIEHKLAVHGGNTNALRGKAEELAKTTCMSFKEAVSKVISEDKQTTL